MFVNYLSHDVNLNACQCFAERTGGSVGKFKITRLIKSSSYLDLLTMVLRGMS